MEGLCWEMGCSGRCWREVAFWLLPLGEGVGAGEDAQGGDGESCEVHDD